MISEMKHCPFCPDFRPFTASRKVKGSGMHIGTAGCAMCGATIERNGDAAEEAVSKAIKAWNTRVKVVE